MQGVGIWSRDTCIKQSALAGGYDPSTGETETEGALGLRGQVAKTTWQVPG